ncbi:MAG TPA: Uma2 family endonuclease [Ilumatobacter sp.]|nr:Uma2 family endonuclease [Ilumatobacter sp.]
MSDAVIQPRHSFDDYERLLTASEFRLEYVDGYIRVMAGGTGRHNVISGNLYAATRAAGSAAGCTAYIEGRRLDIASSDNHVLRSYFPDVMVVCTPLLDAPADRSPCFVAEVLSDSTASVDNIEKLAAYTTLDSVLAYALVSQHERRVVLHRRYGDGFRAEVYSAGESFQLDCPLTTIAVDDLYSGL